MCKSRIFAQYGGVKIRRKMLFHRALYPHVDGEGFHVVKPEQHHSVCDLVPNTLKLFKLASRCLAVGGDERVKVNTARGDR